MKSSRFQTCSDRHEGSGSPSPTPPGTPFREDGVRPWPAWTALAVILAAASCRPANVSPSFDCNAAEGAVQELICQDAALAALDRRLAEVYETALPSGPEERLAEKRARQRGWMQGRDDCWKADDIRSCVELSYRTRLAELQIQSGGLTASRAVDYACAGGDDRPLTVRYYQEIEPSGAVIAYGDDQVIALGATGGEGPRYAAEGVVLREMPGGIAVEWFGTALACQAIPSSQTAPAARPSLAGTSWRLVEFQSMDDTTLTPEATYTLSFDDDGTLRVQADCNLGRGRWRSTDGVTLEIGPVALTAAACPPSPIGDRFARDLAAIRSYVFRGGHLYLSLMADGGIYELAAIPGESIAAER